MTLVLGHAYLRRIAGSKAYFEYMEVQNIDT